MINLDKFFFYSRNAGFKLGDYTLDSELRPVTENKESQKILNKIYDFVKANPIFYRTERELRYPLLSEQIDCIYKGFKQLEETGITWNKDTKKWLDLITNIKEQVPKEDPVY